MLNADGDALSSEEEAESDDQEISTSKRLKTYTAPSTSAPAGSPAAGAPSALAAAAATVTHRGAGDISVAAAPPLQQRRSYTKSECLFCHKWIGNNALGSHQGGKACERARAKQAAAAAAIAAAATGKTPDPKPLNLKPETRNLNP